MPDVDVESFLSSLSDAAPSGADLEYDDAFRRLTEAGEDKPEVEYGDKKYPPQPPNWPAVREEALALAARTRDLRVAVWLARSGARLGGLAGYTEGLRIVQGLLEGFWPTLHPQLDASDGNDPTARMNAMVPLLSPAAGLADLRAANLTDQRTGPTVRSIELAFKAADPLSSEAVPTEAGIVQAIRAAEARAPGLIALLDATGAAFAAIVRAIEERVSLEFLPDFDALAKLVRSLTRAAASARGEPVAGSVPAVEGVEQPAARDAGPRLAGQALETREDAIRILEQVCNWLERNDASNPAPLLIRRAQRLMQKSFLDIIRDLAPDTLDQIEKLAGTNQS